MTFRSASTKLRWLARLALALGALVLVLLALSPWAVPALLRAQVPRLAHDQLGRQASVGAVHFNPLLLQVQVRDLRVRDAAGRADALRLDSGVLRLSWSSLFTLQPRVDRVRLQGLTLRVVRLPDGRLDVDDILRRLAARAAHAPPGPAPRLTLRALDLSQGALEFDDRVSGTVLRLQQLHAALRDLSTMRGGPGLGLSAEALLDGAPLRLNLRGSPGGSPDQLDAELQLRDLNLAPWARLQPASLEPRLQQGRLSLQLHMALPLHGKTGPDIRGNLDLTGLRLTQAQTPIAGADSLHLSVLEWRPLARLLRLGPVGIQGAWADLDPQQLAQWRPAPATAPASRAAPPAPPWQVQCAGIEMTGARLRWSDAGRRPAVDWTVQFAALHAGALSWPLRQPVQVSADATGPQDLGLRVEAEVDAQRAHADVQLRNLDPRLGQAYAPAVPLPQGRVEAHATLDWQAQRLRLRLPEAQWRGFAWGGAQGPQARAIALRDAELDWNARSGAVQASAAGVSIEQPRAGNAAALRAAALNLSGLRLDLAQHRVRIANLQLQRPQASLARDSSGQWSVHALLPSAVLPGARTGAAARAAPGPAWQVELDRAAMTGGNLFLADTLPANPVVLAVTGVNAELHQAAWPARKPIQLSLQARIRDARQDPELETAATQAGATPNLRFQGTVLPSPLQVSGHVQARGLPAQVAGDYLPRLNARVLRAAAGADGDITLRAAPGGTRLDFLGNARVDDFAADTVQPQTSLLGWEALRLNTLQLHYDSRRSPATRADVAQVELRNFYARLVLDAHAHLNVAEVFKPLPAGASAGPQAGPAASAPAAAAVPASAPTPALRPAASGSAPAMDLRVGGVTLSGGRIDWSDQFIQPHYSASLSQVQGSIGSFSSVGTEPARVDLHAVAEGTAPVALAGKINPLRNPPELDLQGRMDDLQLAPLSPYSARYAGYGIERGLLSMNLHYAIDPKGQLQAENRLILRQLTFGPRVDSPQATKLPVLLAVDLLKDRNGNINLDIPISGSLDDPQFSLGSVIAQAVVKLLLRAITAPFTLLSHVFAGGSTAPRLDVVPFAPGRARIDPAMEAKLTDIAQALKAKPDLIVTITGRACPDAEAQALREAELQDQLLALWRRDLPRAERYAHANAQQVPPADEPRVLARLYRDTALPGKPRDALGIAKTVSAQQMRQLLLQAEPAGPDHLQALSMLRAVAVRSALDARGVPGARQFIAAPLLGASDGAVCEPSARLSLSLP